MGFYLENSLLIIRIPLSYRGIVTDIVKKGDNKFETTKDDNSAYETKQRLKFWLEIVQRFILILKENIL